MNYWVSASIGSYWGIFYLEFRFALEVEFSLYLVFLGI